MLLHGLHNCICSTNLKTTNQMPLCALWNDALRKSSSHSSNIVVNSYASKCFIAGLTSGTIIFVLSATIFGMMAFELD